MSLFFGAATTDKVDCGSGSTLDDLPSAAAGFTVLSIVRRTSNGINFHISTKDGSVNNGWLFSSDGTINGDLRFIVWRPTRTDYQTNIVCLPLNEWGFAAAAFKDSDATEVSLYYATMSGAVAEATYVLAQNGVSAPGSDAAYNLWIGNNQRAPTYPFKGDIGVVAIVNRRMTLAECEDWKNNPRMIDGCVLFQRLGENGTGTQPDYSGNGNSGTVTGATQSDNPPIRRPYRALTLVTPTPATPSSVLPLISSALLNSGRLTHGRLTA